VEADRGGQRRRAVPGLSVPSNSTRLRRTGGRAPPRPRAFGARLRPSAGTRRGRLALCAARRRLPRRSRSGRYLRHFAPPIATDRGPYRAPSRPSRNPCRYRPRPRFFRARSQARSAVSVTRHSTEPQPACRLRQDCRAGRRGHQPTWRYRPGRREHGRGVASMHDAVFEPPTPRRSRARAARARRARRRGTGERPAGTYLIRLVQNPEAEGYVTGWQVVARLAA
jgi:hypothetical protein